MNQKQTLSDFSATGDNLDVVAPGEDLLSTSYLWGYMAADGTSLSDAHVTGLAFGQPIEPGMEPEISLEEDVPEYEETAYVKGEWSGADHIDLVNGTGITPTYLDMNMVNHYVRYADVYFNVASNSNCIVYVRAFHAHLNYVATSRFLYSVAYYYVAAQCVV